MKLTLPLSTPQQLKALSDPLRSRILEMFVEESLTVQQAAKRLGRGRHALYHHVRVLEKARLVALVRRRKKRGTTEKYYRAVAKTYRLQPQLFGRLVGPKARAGAALDLVSNVLKVSWREIQDGVRSGDILPGDTKQGVQVIRLRVRTSPRRVAALKRQFQAWVRACVSADSKQGTVVFGFASVRYPMPVRCLEPGSS